MKENETGRAYGTHGDKVECVQSFGGEIKNNETNLKA